MEYITEHFRNGGMNIKRRRKRRSRKKNI